MRDLERFGEILTTDMCAKDTEDLAGVPLQGGNNRKWPYNTGTSSQASQNAYVLSLVRVRCKIINEFWRDFNTNSRVHVPWNPLRHCASCRRVLSCEGDGCARRSFSHRMMPSRGL